MPKKDKKKRQSPADVRTVSKTGAQGTVFTTIGTFSLTDSGIAKTLKNNGQPASLKPSIVDRDLKQHNYEPGARTLIIPINQEKPIAQVKKIVANRKTTPHLTKGKKRTPESKANGRNLHFDLTSKITGNVYNQIDMRQQVFKAQAVMEEDKKSVEDFKHQVKIVNAGLNIIKGKSPILNALSRGTGFLNGSISLVDNIIDPEGFNSLRESLGGGLEITKAIKDETPKLFEGLEKVNSSIDAAKNLESLIRGAEGLEGLANTFELASFIKNLTSILDPQFWLPIMLTILYDRWNEKNEEEREKRNEVVRHKNYIATLREFIATDKNTEEYIKTGNINLLPNLQDRRKKVFGQYHFVTDNLRINIPISEIQPGSEDFEIYSPTYILPLSVDTALLRFDDPYDLQNKFQAQQPKPIPDSVFLKPFNDVVLPGIGFRLLDGYDSEEDREIRKRYNLFSSKQLELLVKNGKDPFSLEAQKNALKKDIYDSPLAKWEKDASVDNLEFLTEIVRYARVFEARKELNVRREDIFRPSVKNTSSKKKTTKKNAGKLPGSQKKSHFPVVGSVNTIYNSTIDENNLHRMIENHLVKILDSLNTA